MRTLSLFLIMLISANLQAKSEAGFICIAEKADFNGYFLVDVKIEGFLESNLGTYKLSHYQIEYQVHDGDEIWSQANIHSTSPILNNPLYKPRVYKDHVQFNLSKDIFGEIYFLVPKDFSTSEDDRFQAFAIMTEIEDHAGDTVKLECSID